MGRFFSGLIFWACVIGILVYGYQNNWFSFFQNAVGAVKSDVEYQKSLTNYEDEQEYDNGIITIEKTRSNKKTYGINATRSSQY